MTYSKVTVQNESKSYQSCYIKHIDQIDFQLLNIPDSFEGAELKTDVCIKKQPRGQGSFVEDCNLPQEQGQSTL